MDVRTPRARRCQPTVPARHRAHPPLRDVVSPGAHNELALAIPHLAVRGAANMQEREVLVGSTGCGLGASPIRKVTAPERRPDCGSGCWYASCEVGGMADPRRLT